MSCPVGGTPFHWNTVSDLVCFICFSPSRFLFVLSILKKHREGTQGVPSEIVMEKAKDHAGSRDDLALTKALGRVFRPQAGKN